MEDVADAIFRASHSDLSGVYNVSRNSETSVNTLTSSLIALHGSGEVKYEPAREGDIRRSSLSNKKLRSHLDWAPLFDLEDGLQRTYAYFKTKQEKHEKVDVPKEGRFLSSMAVQTAKPYVENMLAFLIVALLFFYGDLGLQQSIGIAIVVYIVLLGILYGKRQAVLAAGLSILLLLYGRLAEGREFISLLYDTAFLFQATLYLFIALVIGYTVQRKNNIILAQKEQVQLLEEKYDLLNEVHDDVLDVKNALRHRILTDEDSFGKVHSLLKELDRWDPETVYTQTVEVVRKVLNAKEVTLLRISEDREYAWHIARSGPMIDQSLGSLKVKDNDFLRYMFEKDTLFVNKDLNPSYPMMAAPIHHNGKIIAIACVNGIGFEQMSLYSENVLRIVTDMAGIALSRMWTFIEAMNGNRHVPGTALLRRELFQEILECKRKTQEKGGLPFTVLDLPARGDDLGNCFLN